MDTDTDTAAVDPSSHVIPLFPPPLDNIHVEVQTRRLLAIYNIRPPACGSVIYKEDSRVQQDVDDGTHSSKKRKFKSSTKIPYSSVQHSPNVPKTFLSRPLDDMMKPLFNAMLDYVSDVSTRHRGGPYHFAQDYFYPPASTTTTTTTTTTSRSAVPMSELLSLLQEDIKDDAANIRPEGEFGLSHWLQKSLFDHLNRLLRWSLPKSTSTWLSSAQEQVEDQQSGPGFTRYWEPIGTGGTGQTDWGLFVDGELVVVVEIRPHKVSIVYHPEFSLGVWPRAR